MTPIFPADLNEPRTRILLTCLGICSLIVVAVLALCVGHPGLIFSPAQMRKTSATTTVTVDEGRIEK